MSCAGGTAGRLSAAIAVVMANLSATDGSIHATASVNFQEVIFQGASL